MIYWYGTEGDNNIMVMDLLGPNIEDIFNMFHKKFTFKTSITVAIQIVNVRDNHRYNGFNMYIPKIIFIVILNLKIFC